MSSSSYDYGVLGMKSSARVLDITASNIASQGVKGGKEFFPLITNRAIGDSILPNTSGITMMENQGTIGITHRSNDLALDGQGFLVMKSPNGGKEDLKLTRFGSMYLDGEGNFRSYINRHYLCAVPIDKIVEGKDPIFDDLITINLQVTSEYFRPTANLNLGGNLPSEDDITKNNVYRNAERIIDNAGNTRYLNFSWQKTSISPLNWELKVAVGDDPNVVVSGAPLTINFDANGSTLNLGPTIPITIQWGGTMGDQVIRIGNTTNRFGSSFTSKAGPFSMELPSDDGIAKTALEGMEVDERGWVYKKAMGDEGTRTKIARIPLALVASPNSLSILNNNLLGVNSESGGMILGWPADKGRGLIISGGLEESNIDLATQMARLIEVELIYSFSSKAVSTKSSVDKTLIEMKR